MAENSPRDLLFEYHQAFVPFPPLKIFIITHVEGIPADNLGHHHSTYPINQSAGSVESIRFTSTARVKYPSTSHKLQLQVHLPVSPQHLSFVPIITPRPNLPIGRNFVEVVSHNYAYPLLMIDSRQSGEVAYNLVHPFTKQIIERIS